MGGVEDIVAPRTESIPDAAVEVVVEASPTIESGLVSDAKGDVDKQLIANKATVKKELQRMSRLDLEDLILAKVVEGIIAHTEIGHLRSEVIQLQTLRDKLQIRVGSLQSQVREMSAAVDSLIENQARLPQHRMSKPPSVRFVRNVGSQTLLEPSVRLPAPKIIRVPVAAPHHDLKQYGKRTATSVPLRLQPRKRSNVVAPSNSVGMAHKIITPSPRPSSSPHGQAPSSGPERMVMIASKPPSILDSSKEQLVQCKNSTLANAGPKSLAESHEQSAIAVTKAALEVSISPNTTSAGVPFLELCGAVGAKTSGLEQNGSQVANHQKLAGRGGGVTDQLKVGYRVNGDSAPVRSNLMGPPLPSILPSVAPPSASYNLSGHVILPPLPTAPPPKDKVSATRQPPTKPVLSLKAAGDLLCLEWNLPLPSAGKMARMHCYQIYSAQVDLSDAAQGVPPNPIPAWDKIGDTPARSLAMTCSLATPQPGIVRYYIIVRGIDIYGRAGPFCDIQEIVVHKIRG